MGNKPNSTMPVAVPVNTPIVCDAIVCEAVVRAVPINNRNIIIQPKTIQPSDPPLEHSAPPLESSAPPLEPSAPPVMPPIFTFCNGNESDCLYTLKEAIFQSKKLQAGYIINMNVLTIDELREALNQIDNHYSIKYPKNKTRPIIRKMIINKLNELM